MTLTDAFEKLAAAHLDWRAATFAVGRTLDHASADPTILTAAPAPRIEEPLELSHLRGCAARLEPTYVVRLFAEFEYVLRDFLAAARPSPRPRRTNMIALINRIASVRAVPFNVLDEAHEVREFRNTLVHDVGRASGLSLAQCKSRLSRYLSYLPRQW